MSRPEYLILLRPTNDGWRAVILKGQEQICPILPATREKPTVSGEWWLDYLIKPSPEIDQLHWEPLNMAIQQVPGKIPHDLACILIRHL
ncbi:MAG: hypothetical protein WEC81_02065 [Patescibacteria group bacterium]